MGIESNEEVTITTTIDGNKGQSILECRSTPMSLAGKFSCQISNPVGHVLTTSLITVLPGIPTLKGFKLSKPVAPSVAKPLMNIDDVAEHKKITLECAFTGSKPLNITWLRDGQVIQQSNVNLMSFN